MNDKMVWVEEDRATGCAIRIFKHTKDAFNSDGYVMLWLRSKAVWNIRHACFLRSRGECEICTAPVTEVSGHMHEKLHRGKGGEISLVNSVFICPPCHKRQHADREGRWTKST